jgi:2-dehydropantoate 2-reductase
LRITSETECPLPSHRAKKSARVAALGGILRRAGFKCPVKANLGPEIWMKLLGNLSFNRVSVLTADTMLGMTQDPHARSALRSMMLEARAVAEALGVPIAVDVDDRIDMAARAGAHRTSMLQDVQAGRPTEIDALLGSVIEVGRITGTPTPALNLVYDLTRAHVRAAEIRRDR